MIYKNLLLLTALICLTSQTVNAQFRERVPNEFPQTQLYSPSNKVGALLSKIFNPSVFQMRHSFEMSAGSFGGRGYSMGMYTNTLAWQFSSKLAARMDIAVAYSPQNRIAQSSGFAQQRPEIFLRNASVTWKPSERVSVHFHVQQNPYAYHRMGYGPYGSRWNFQPYGTHLRF